METDRIQTPYLEDSVHDRVLLHRGLVPIRRARGDREDWDGMVTFEWLPTPHTVVMAASSPTPADLKGLVDEQERTHVGLPSLDDVTRQSAPDPSADFVTTESPLATQLGRRSAMDRIIFSVINGPELWGHPLQDRMTIDTRARVRLNGGGWNLTLDQRSGHKGFGDELRRIGGYGTTHIGELRRVRGGRFGAAQAEVVLGCLAYFLSFLRGRWVSTALPIGYLGKEVAWLNWSAGQVDRYLGSFSWFDQTLTPAAEDLWPTFLRRWNEPSDQTVLRRLISYWIGSNLPRPVEVGYTLAVTGLDLAGWHSLVVNGSESASAWEKTSAADRIRATLSAWQIPASVPIELARLANEATATGVDGPALLARGRNRFMHPRPGSKQDLPSEVLPEAWLLATWYLELCLLGWLGFVGKYKRRTDPDRWIGVVEDVPWSRP